MEAERQLRVEGEAESSRGQREVEDLRAAKDEERRNTDNTVADEGDGDLREISGNVARQSSECSSQRPERAFHFVDVDAMRSAVNGCVERLD